MTSVGANVPSHKLAIKASEVLIPIGKEGQLISLQELSVISTHDIQKLTGEKMSLSEKISFKAAQRQLRHSIHRDGTLDKNFGRMMGGGVHWGGLALGFFLFLIGVLIAYLIKTGDTKGRIKWAWIGAAISFVVFGTILIL
jgi:hypothetical protein